MGAPSGRGSSFPASSRWRIDCLFRFVASAFRQTMRRLFHTARTASPVRDLGLVYLIALAVLRRQTWDLANRAVDVNDATADATDQVVMVVADPRFESGRGSRWLNA